MEIQELTSAIDELCHPFYKDWGFWISSILAVLGMAFSIGAYVEARNAKREAGKAADAVRRQAAVLDISEITRMCQIDEDISYPDAAIRINEITAKVKVIIGIYKARLTISHQALLQQVEGAILNTRSALDRVNPLSEGELKSSHDNMVYYTIEPHIASMVSTLNELKGTLDTLMPESK